MKGEADIGLGMGWRFLFPPAQWLRAYGLKWLQSDALDGLTSDWAITALAGLMYVANPQRTGNTMWRFIYEYKPRVMALDRSTIPDFEYTSWEMLWQQPIIINRVWSEPTPERIHDYPQ